MIKGKNVEIKTRLEQKIVYYEKEVTGSFLEDFTNLKVNSHEQIGALLVLEYYKDKIRNILRDLVEEKFFTDFDFEKKRINR